MTRPNQQLRFRQDHIDWFDLEQGDWIDPRTFLLPVPEWIRNPRFTRAHQIGFTQMGGSTAKGSYLIVTHRLPQRSLVRDHDYDDTLHPNTLIFLTNTIASQEVMECLS